MESLMAQQPVESGQPQCADRQSYPIAARQLSDTRQSNGNNVFGQPGIRPICRAWSPPERPQLPIVGGRDAEWRLSGRCGAVCRQSWRFRSRNVQRQRVFPESSTAMRTSRIRCRRLYRHVNATVPSNYQLAASDNLSILALRGTTHMGRSLLGGCCRIGLCAKER